MLPVIVSVEVTVAKLVVAKYRLRVVTGTPLLDGSTARHIARTRRQIVISVTTSCRFMNQVPRDVPPYSSASPELSVLKKGETQITQHAESPEPSLSYLHSL
jgi:hypothetical protein